MTNNEEYINLIKDWIKPLQKSLTIEAENKFSNLLGRKKYFNDYLYESLNNLEYLKLNDEKKVENLSFEGEGCAISLASASILTEIIKGKDFKSAKKITNEFLTMIKDKKSITNNNLNKDQKTTIMSLSGVKEFPMRVKCATMAWHTFVSALEGKSINE